MSCTPEASSHTAVLRYRDTAKAWKFSHASRSDAAGCGWRTAIQRGLHRGWGVEPVPWRLKCVPGLRTGGVHGNSLLGQIMRAGEEIICKWKWLNWRRVEETALDDCKPLISPLIAKRDERATASPDAARLTGHVPREWSRIGPGSGGVWASPTLAARTKTRRGWGTRGGGYPIWENMGGAPGEARFAAVTWCE